MSLEKENDSNEKPVDVGKKSYEWKGFKKRMQDLDDLELLRHADNLRYREALGEDLSQSDRIALKMAKRVEEKKREEKAKQRKALGETDE